MISIKERVLVEVHIKALIRWANNEWRGAADLLKEIEKVEEEYARIIVYTGDPWSINCDEEWDQFATDIGQDVIVDLAGIQTTICVAKTREQLRKRGIPVTDDNSLTMDFQPRYN